jgi:hypothetical protein
MEVSDELREEAARDLELAASMPLPKPTAPGSRLPQPKLENPFVTPAFLAEGGGARGEVATAGATIEPGSIREFACRATAAVALLAGLCVCLGIGSAASPWFALLVPSSSCSLVYSLSAFGTAGGCAGITTTGPFPRPYSEDARQPEVQEAVGTLGFAAFLLSCAIVAAAGAAGVSGVMAWRLTRGLPPHRHGNAFTLVALTATAFTLSALAMIIGSARLLLALTRAQSAIKPVVAAGHGSGDAMVVFLCGAMVAAVLVKIRVRAAAVLAEGSHERGELEALLGTEPEGHFCL